MPFWKSECAADSVNIFADLCFRLRMLVIRSVVKDGEWGGAVEDVLYTKWFVNMHDISYVIHACIAAVEHT